MKLGIVTPTLNAEKYLKRCLESIWSQQTAGFEVDHLIVDGASTDRTTEIATGYPSRVVVARDGGMYEAVNRGFSLVEGDVVAYVNADDELSPGALRRVAERFSSDPALSWLCGAVDFIDGDGRFLGRLRLVPFSTKEFVGLGWSPIYSMTVWKRRSFLDEVGPYDTSFRNAADYDWYARAMQLKRPKLEKAVLARFRIHDTNLSKDLDRLALESRNIQARYGGLSRSSHMAGMEFRVRLNLSNPKWLVAKKTGRIQQGSLRKVKISQ